MEMDVGFVVDAESMEVSLDADGSGGRRGICKSVIEHLFWKLLHVNLRGSKDNARAGQIRQDKEN
jgi:hypothetical protein